MKTFEMNLMEDKTIIIKGETYEDLLGEIDRALDVIKSNVIYYLGSSDDSVIEELKEEEINFEVE